MTWRRRLRRYLPRRGSSLSEEFLAPGPLDYLEHGTFRAVFRLIFFPDVLDPLSASALFVAPVPLHLFEDASHSWLVCPRELCPTRGSL